MAKEAKVLAKFVNLVRLAPIHVIYLDFENKNWTRLSFLCLFAMVGSVHQPNEADNPIIFLSLIAKKPVMKDKSVPPLSGILFGLIYIYI